MENNLYRLIIRVAAGILFVMSAVVFLFARDLSYICSIWLGGMLSMAGFVAIVFSAKHMEWAGNIQRRMFAAYLFRYLFYFVAMFLGAKAGLNILLMLIGFLCISLSIKWITFLKRKEDS